MGEHAIVRERTDTGSHVARCACGQTFHADSLDDLALAMGEHLMEIGEAERCPKCQGPMVPYVSTRGTIEPEYGRCGSCVRDQAQTRAYRT